ALSKARVPEAKEALLFIKRNDSAVMMDQVRAMFGLVTRDDVGHELATELASDVRKHAAKRSHDHDFLAGESMLALSTMSGLRDDSTIAATSRQALEETVSTSPLASQTLKVALHAIGNTGDPGMLPMVGGYTDAPDIDTRKAAAHAFSRMPAAVADPLELAWLKRETSPFVKKEMYRVFQQQHLDLNQGASRELVEHTLAELPTVKAAYTRKHMVLLVAQSSVAKEPDIRRRLVEQAKWERARGTVLLNQFATILTRDEIAEVLR
ncbi:MAG: hypothetical protein JNG84_04065, partial [Archangium sp.]|nr:hypothetical protein [Archangium sp.]